MRSKLVLPLSRHAMRANDPRFRYMDSVSAQDHDIEKCRGGWQRSGKCRARTAEGVKLLCNSNTQQLNASLKDEGSTEREWTNAFKGIHLPVFL